MSKTIDLIAKEKCTGCGACYNACPCNAISMKPDKDGFITPTITTELCSECGVCVKSCPVSKASPAANGGKHIYAASTTFDIQSVCSSGGVFSLLASYVRARKGYVVGAAFTPDYQGVQHQVISPEEDLQPLRKSKYVQSDTGTTFRKVRELLKKNLYVLFSGCPCQVAGLKSFLGKDYENLLLVDIVCHGVPSPKCYTTHLKEIAQNRKIACVDFREKTHFGWSTPFTVFFKNGDVYRESCTIDVFYKGFLDGLITRESCATCPYATPFTHVADITLGDFWGIQQIDPSSYDKHGVNLVLTNTPKGETILHAAISESNYEVHIKEQSMNKSIELAKTRNGQFIAPKKAHWARKRFFELLDKKGYETAYDMAVNGKYDVGIVGWWNNENYGGILTYYALYTFIKSLNLEPLMIRHIRWQSEIEPNTNSLVYRFAKKHYAISKNYKKEELYSLNEKIGCFISGSDQLFNPYLWAWSGKEYFLQFVSNQNKLISYASSFGNSYNHSNAHHMEIAYYLHRFDFLSVREDYAVDIMENEFDLKATHVVDPVFLCNPSEYHSLADTVSLKLSDPYFVSFILDPSPEKRELILHLEEKTNKNKIILLDMANALHFEKQLNLPNSKPLIEAEEWLAYYRQAEYIVTDSFHGTCFALVFRKPFVALANPKRGTRRLESVLRIANLTDRLFYKVDAEQIYQKLLQPINYEEVYSNLQPKIEESKAWLKNALLAERKSGNDMWRLLDSQLSQLQREYYKQISNLATPSPVKKKKTIEDYFKRLSTKLPVKTRSRLVQIYRKCKNTYLARKKQS